MEVSEKEWNALLKRVERLEAQVRAARSFNRDVLVPNCRNVDHLLSIEANKKREAQQRAEEYALFINRLLGNVD